MKVGDLVRISSRGFKQKQNKFIAWGDMGFIIGEVDADRLYYVTWFNHISKTLHYRYELRFAK